MASYSYPVSTTEMLIVPVASIGFTVLGKALARTFVEPRTSSSDNTQSVSPQDFGIGPEEWSLACQNLSQALHAAELSTAVGILQWVPLVVFAGPIWINVRAERKQRTNIYMELAKLDQSTMQPRNLQLQLHVHNIHRGRSIDQWAWLSISNIRAGQRQPVLVFTGNQLEKEKKFNAACRSIYKKCEAKVANS